MMEVAARKILLLAGRLNDPAEADRIGRLAGRLAAVGLRVEVLCVSANGLVEPIPGLVECPALGGRWFRGRALRRLVEEDKPARPDLIQVVQAEAARSGLDLAELWRVPYVLNVDEFLPPGGRIRVGRRRCRALVVSGKALADDLIRAARVPEALISVVPPGIAIPDEPAGPTGAGKVAVVGTAGPLVAGAGLANFLEAARWVVDSGIDAEFVIAGQGPGEADLRRHAERLRLAERVTFAPPPVSDAPFWRVLDAFCLAAMVPTVGPTLGTALAHGVPAIASDVEGLRDWVPADGGRIVPPGDPVALARTILELLADPEAARAMGSRGRSWIARAFAPDQEVRALVDLYRRVLASHCGEDEGEAGPPDPGGDPRGDDPGTVRVIFGPPPPGLDPGSRADDAPRGAA